jgi:hypothetical protein
MDWAGTVGDCALGVRLPVSMPPRAPKKPVRVGVVVAGGVAVVETC